MRERDSESSAPLESIARGPVGDDASHTRRPGRVWKHLITGKSALDKASEMLPFALLALEVTLRLPGRVRGEEGKEER